MKGDDDAEDEGEGNVGSVRYPCMPSLVALQQMRNRLHMAYLGKRLMKWTAIATGKELRKVSQDINCAYEGFAEDVREAYIILARCRYFYKNLNSMVLQNPPKCARITVEKKPRSIAGCKLINYEIVDDESDQYVYYGIEKGGQIIEETKQVWVELLKRMIIIVNLRSAFNNVDEANKGATKKMNVLAKIVIPRTNNTVKYILIELEELEREDFYRLKCVLKKKIRTKAALKKGDNVDAASKKLWSDVEQYDQYIECPISFQDIADAICAIPEKVLNIVQSLSRPSLQTEIPYKSMCDICSSKVKIVKKIILSPYKEGAPAKEVVSSRQLVKPATEYLPISELLTTCLKNKPDGHNIEFDNKPVVCNYMKLKLVDKQKLKDVLIAILHLSKQLLQHKGAVIDDNEFLESCDTTVSELQKVIDSTEPIKRIDSQTKCQLKHLKDQIKEIMDVINELEEEIYLSPSIEMFLNLCDDVDKKIDIYLQEPSCNIQASTKNKLETLKEQIDNLKKVTRATQIEGLHTVSVDKFINTCDVFKSKIDNYTQDIAEDPIHQIAAHISHIDSLTRNIKSEGFVTPSMEKFLKACKDFNLKLENLENTKREENSTIDLLNQINETIKLTKAASGNGQVSQNLINFVKSCEDIKQKIIFKDSIKTSVKDELKCNIDDVIDKINNQKRRGLASKSVDDFIQSCNLAKLKLDEPPKKAENNVLCAPSDSCVCSLIQRLQGNMFNQDRSKTANSCLINMPSMVQQLEEINKMCVPLTENEIKANVEVTNNDTCNSCQNSSPKPRKDEKAPSLSEEKDSQIGTFINTKRNITRVTRTLNPDGTITETRETVTIDEEVPDTDNTNSNSSKCSAPTSERRAKKNKSVKNNAYVGACLLNISEGFKKDKRRPQSLTSIFKPRFDDFGKTYCSSAPLLFAGSSNSSLDHMESTLMFETIL